MTNRDCLDAVAGARSYWGRFFGLHPEELDGSDVLVVPHAVLGDYAGAWVWWQDSCTIVSVPQDMVADRKRRVSIAEVEAFRGVTTVAAFFGDRAGTTIGPAYHGWLESRVSGREDDASVLPGVCRASTKHSCLTWVLLSWRELSGSWSTAGIWRCA